MLNIITNSYILPFITKPKLVPLIHSGYKAHQKDLALASCIQTLLSKSAIERVENVNSLGFYSCLFQVKRLSTFLLVERFKMETSESIRASLIPGKWVSSIDLSDTYLHITIHQNSIKYLQFCQNSQVFLFTSFFFGLATAPRLYNDYEGVKLMALKRGVRLHQYLDNWLIRAPSQKEAQVNTQMVVDLTHSLGWIINQEKSELKPTHDKCFRLWATKNT